jgi:hypothetical protein
MTHTAAFAKVFPQWRVYVFVGKISNATPVIMMYDWRERRKSNKTAHVSGGSRGNRRKN